VTRSGVQKYQCQNPACPQRCFRAERYQSPFASPAAYQRYWRAEQKRKAAAVKAPVRRGDCTLWQADCLALLQAGIIPAHSVDLILADLPYGTTACDWDSVVPLGQLWPAYRRVLTPAGAVLFTAGGRFRETLIQSNPRWFRYDLVWAKTTATGQMQAPFRPLPAHEYVLVFAKGQTTYHQQREEGFTTVAAFEDKTKTTGEVYAGPKGGKRAPTSKHRANTDGTRCPQSVLIVPPDPPDLQSTHPTPKPVALMRWLIKTYSHEGETVLDNTMGAGATGVACVQTERRFLGIELRPDYFTEACTRVGTALSKREEQARQGELFATGVAAEGQLLAAG
jgi:site-specific DNA-methyltransferase (adenine-specific)